MAYSKLPQDSDILDLGSFVGLSEPHVNLYDMFKSLVTGMICLLMLGKVSILYAQPAPGPASDSNLTEYFGVSAGRLLPYGIFGVRSVAPYWGVRFGHALGEFNPEYSFTHVRGEGAVFYSGSFSLTFHSKFENLEFIPLLGIDFHRYRGRTIQRELAFTQGFGTHVGVSPIIKINEAFRLRVDFKMGFGPGTTLLVGVGAVSYF
jgi:hypothetical protein